MNTVHFDNWFLTTQFSSPDYIAPFGTMNGHPKFDGKQAIPGRFRFFDTKFRVAFSASGTKYVFGEFVPNGNAKTEQAAFEWLSNNWMLRGD